MDGGDLDDGRIREATINYSTGEIDPLVDSKRRVGDSHCGDTVCSIRSNDWPDGENGNLGGELDETPEKSNLPDNSSDTELGADRVGILDENKARLSAQHHAKLSAQPKSNAIVFNKNQWKRSRIKKGQLIKRLTGYSIAETEYGVSYLWVLSRKPDRTTADNSVYPLAGYFNWKSLEQSGLLKKEKMDAKRK